MTRLLQQSQTRFCDGRDDLRYWLNSTLCDDVPLVIAVAFVVACCFAPRIVFYAPVAAFVTVTSTLLVRAIERGFLPGMLLCASIIAAACYSGAQLWAVSLLMLGYARHNCAHRQRIWPTNLTKGIQ